MAGQRIDIMELHRQVDTGDRPAVAVIKVQGVSLQAKRNPSYY